MGAGTGFDQGGSSSGSGVQSVVAGSGIDVDNTDPVNPIVSLLNSLPYLALDDSGATLSLTGNTNNLDVGAYSFASLSATSAFDLTGLDSHSAQDFGKIVYLFNIGSNIITIRNNTTSSISNRFDLYPAADLTLNPKQVLGFIYVNGRWRSL